MTVPTGDAGRRPADGTGTLAGAPRAAGNSEELLRAWIAERRSLVAASLEEHLERRAGTLAKLSPVGAELVERLLEFALRGKMMRGILVGLGAELAVPERSAVLERALGRASAAMELLQAGLLVHDDIMDGDETRRGKPTMHVRYAIEARAEGAAEAARMGESLGVCAGDVAYFEAFAALAEAFEGLPGAAGMLGLCARELSLVGLGQMEDVRWGGLSAERDEESILRMYRAKTARYTFSLPLALGALMAGGDEPGIRALAERLMEIGELAGQVFQIRDDELGIFGSAEEIGKPVGSDIREGKKTLWRARLMAKAGGAERARLESVFGDKAASPGDIAWVQGLMASSGVRAELGGLAASLAAKARALVASAPGLREEAKPLLVGLVDWSAGRRK